MAPVVQERTRLLPEAGAQVVFLFEDFADYEADAWEKVMLTEEVGAVLEAGRAAVAAADPWDVATIETALRALPEQLGVGAGKVFQPLRVAVTGSSVSPPLFESIAALGRDRTLQRIDRARRELG